MADRVQALFESVKARDPAQPEFLQAVEEVSKHLKDKAFGAAEVYIGL